MKTRRISLIILLSLLLMGCIQNQEPMEPLTPPSQTSLSTPSPELPPQGDVTQNTTTPYPPNLQNMINKATDDLAKRLSISSSQINLVVAIEAVWVDASLGCPQPETLYSQILTEGFLIRLEANSNVYEYHTDSGEQIELCENPEYPVFPVAPGEIDDGRPWMPVDPIQPDVLTPHAKQK